MLCYLFQAILTESSSPPLSFAAVMFLVGMQLIHTRETLLPGSNVSSTEARRDARVLELAMKVVLQLRLAVHRQLMPHVLLLSLQPQ